LGNLPGKYSWLNGPSAMSLAVMSHELGHNFGTHHASELDCTDNGVRVSLSATASHCTTAEYGDPYSVMGMASHYDHTEFARGNFGWLTPANLQTVTASGDYTLAPAEIYAPTQVQTIMIPRTSSTYFNLEFRQPYGTNFDNFSPLSPAVNGVSIRITPSFGTATQSQLVDTTPATTSFTDAPLAVGKTLNDPLTGISITDVAVSSSGATVHISFGGGDTTPPTQPGGLTATPLDQNRISLAWNASSDDVGVSGYRVYRGSTLVATVTSPGYTDAGLSPSTGYTYQVVAFDAAGNSSTAASASATTPAAPTTLDHFTVAAPTSSVAGSAYSITLTAKDSSGNTMTGYRGTVGFTTGDSQGIMPANYTFTTSDDGTHTFTNGVTLKTAGSQTVRVADGSITNTASVTVSPANADHLSFATQPANATAGSPFGQQPVIDAMDPYGNRSSVGLPSSKIVSIALTGGTGPLLGTAALDIGTGAGNGRVSFTNLEIDTVGTGKQLTVSAAGLTSTTSTNFSVSAGALDHFALSAPTGSVAGSSFSFSVTAKDSSGNTITGYVGTVNFTSTDTQASLPPSYTFTASDNGVHTFTNGVTMRTAGGQSVRAASGGVAATASVTVSAASADHLVFATQPGNATAGAPFGQQPVIQARDPFGNPSSLGLPTSKTVSISLTSGSGSLVGSTSADIGTNSGNGTVSFTDLEIDAAGSGDQLTASASGLPAETSMSFSVSAGVLSHFFFTVPGSPVAGSSFSMTVTAKDASGNTLTGYRGTVTFTTSDSKGTLPASYTFTASDNGTHTFANGITLKTAGAQTVGVADGAIAGTAGVTVNPATADHLVFTTQPGGATAGAPFGQQPVVKTSDPYGNPSTVGLPGSRLVSITLASGSGPLQGTLTSDLGTAAGNGTVSFTNLRIDTAGGYQLSASASGLTSATSASFSVSPGSPDHFVLAAPTSATAGNAISLTVTAKDSSGNTVTGYLGTVTFTTTDQQGTLPTSYTYTQSDTGGHTFTNGTTLKTAGSQTVRVASGSMSGTAIVSVSPASLYSIAISPASSTIEAGMTQSYAAEGFDRYGNSRGDVTTATSFSGSSGLTCAGGTCGATTSGSYFVTGADASLTDTAAVQVNPGPPSRLAFSQQPTNQLAGQILTPPVQVAVLDAWGNVVTSASGFVTLGISADPSGSAVLGGTTSEAPTNGVATFADLSIDEPGIGYTLGASGGSIAPTVSTEFDVTAASLSTFAPTAGTVGAIVVISGSQLTGSSEVMFDGVPTAFSVDSDAQITASVPTGADTGPIEIITPVGPAVSESAFQVMPTITGMAPLRGSVGTTVTIQGSAFDGATKVTFGGQPAVFSVNSYSQISATVPAGALTGRVTVTTASGTATSSGSFRVKPTIKSFSPTKGSLGIRVTIRGQALAGATSVMFGGERARFRVLSYTRIVARLPSKHASGRITVRTHGGSGTSRSRFIATS
jgi:hypothetical protein